MEKEMAKFVINFFSCLVCHFVVVVVVVVWFVFFVFVC